MKGFGKTKEGPGREGVPAARAGGIPVGRRIAAGVAAFFVAILLASEIIVVVSYLTPLMAISLYQYSTIVVNETIALGDFAVRDMVFLLMMYGAPLLVACILLAAAEWAVVKATCRFVWGLVMTSIGRGAGKAPAGKGDKGV